MLSLSPPYFSYEGVVVAPDFSDPLQFYYFPDRPHLAIDNGRPAIRLLVFKQNLDELEPGEEQAAGFLYFDTSLAWPEETLEKVAQHIQKDQKLDQLPRLTPLFYRNGSVQLIFLGRKTELPKDETEGSEDEESTEATEPDKWVIKLESSGVPSLYGENRAIFSTVLTKEATQLIYDALDGFVPAGVVYDLEFVGMQRAFNVHVEADWEQIYHFLREKDTLDLWFYNSSEERIVDQLEQNQLIKFTASLEGVDDEAMTAEFNQVRKEVEEFVLDRFFKPVVNPDKQDVNPITDTITDFARGLRNLGKPTVGFSRLELDATELRSLEIDYTMNRAVKRKIAPQAHLSVFFEDFGLTRDDVVKVVNGSDEFWKVVDFSVTANADFNGDGIAMIKVDIAYGDFTLDNLPSAHTNIWSFPLTATNPVQRRSAWYDPVIGHRFLYRYEIIFSPNALPGSANYLQSEWLEGNGNLLVVTPTDLYGKRQVTFQIPKIFPLAEYPMVLAEVRYSDPDSNWTHHDSCLLDAEHLMREISFRTRIDAPDAIEYRYTFSKVDGNVETDWESGAEELILVPDPRPNPYPVEILVGGNRQEIQDLILDLRYEDPENNIFIIDRLRINAENINARHQWIFRRADPTHNRYHFSQTLLTAEGDLITTGWVETDKQTLVVGKKFARLWEVHPELIGPPLMDQGLARIEVHLTYNGNDTLIEKHMTFLEPGAGDTWKLELQDTADRHYQYEIIYVLQNGFERRIGPLSSNASFPVISSVLPL